MNAARQQLTPDQAISLAREKFVDLAGSDHAYQREAMFAMQHLAKSSFVLDTAKANPHSVRQALLNLATIGLTLNPANAYAYLIPRDKAIVLDISYKGLIKIATDCGGIEWARADVVHETDSFEYRGPAQMPHVVANPFAKDRGEIIGAYCVAKTPAGDYLCEVMPMDELLQIRSKSDAYMRHKNGKHTPSGPWVEWFAQMCKKAVVKRASKTWPYSTAATEKLDTAISMANVAEGGYTLEAVDEERAYRRKQQHDAALGRWYENVAEIRIELDRTDAEPDMWKVRQLWEEIHQDDQIALYLAPTKGGIFTTKQRDALKTCGRAREPAQLEHQPEPAIGPRWTCDACDHHNAAHLQRCEACDEVRPADLPA